MSNVLEVMERSDRRARLWTVLENQRKLLDALDKAMAVVYDGDVWVDDALKLRERMAKELYLTVIALWQEPPAAGNSRGAE